MTTSSSRDRDRARTVTWPRRMASITALVIALFQVGSRALSSRAMGTQWVARPPENGPKIRVSAMRFRPWSLRESRWSVTRMPTMVLAVIRVSASIDGGTAQSTTPRSGSVVAPRRTDRYTLAAPMHTRLPS